PVIRAKPEDLAYVIYTSGSTGKPKGAMVEHIGMMNHISAKIDLLNVTPESRIVQNATQCFDISGWQMLTALFKGGTTYIYSNDLILDPVEMIRKVVEHRITILEVVPTFLAMLIESFTKDIVLKDLEYCLVTGEEVKRDLVKQWFDYFPGKRLVNAYGPTEASDDITHYVMDDVPGNSIIPIGKTVQNFNIYIVDRNFRLSPIGVNGEIVVSGVGVGRGYVNNRERTKQSFMSDPFIKERNVRLYKTGDFGRWLPDGNIEFLGRIDNQVKIRGFRIELGEI
ncbi:MAG: amino acid adenylation domain-containing protein, partial [Desulfobacteraceae bacterium]|nr:amino acid adenylation domain-containing protein [Desulfobacteraceae bacterium]